MSLFKSKTKSNLVRLLLGSSALAVSVAYMPAAFAVLTNVGAGPTDAAAKNDGYNFDQNNSILNIVDGIDIGATGAAPSVSLDELVAKVNSTANFAGSSNVLGSIGKTNVIETVNFNGAAGKTVNVAGTVNTSNLGFANGGAVIFNSAVTNDNNVLGNGAGSVTFNAGINQTANDINLGAGFKAIYNADSNIANDLNLGVNAQSQVFTGKVVTVTADLTTAAGSQLTFDLGQTATPGKFVTNTAALTAAQVINVINPGLASYAPGVQRTDVIVNAPGGGILANPTLNANSNLFINYSLLRTPNTKLSLVATRTTPTGLPENIQGVAGVLATVPAGNGALSDLVNQLGTLTADQQRQALKSVAPLIDGAVTEAVMDAQDNTFALFTQRMSQLQAGLGNYHTGYAAGSMDERGHGTWVKLFGRHADQNERSDVDGYKAETWGVAAGVDMMFNERFLVGLGLSWASIDVNHDLNDGDTDIDSYQASLYGSWNINGPLFFNWMASAAYNDYDMTRHTIVGAFNQTTIADFHGWSYGAKGELGYVLGDEGLHVTPMLTLRYAHVEIDGYRENGPSALNQNVNYDNIDALWAGAGVKLSYDVDCRDSLISPEVHANIAYDVIGDEARANSQFVSFGPVYETVGASAERTDYNLGLSITTQGKSGLGLTLSYDHNWKSDYHANSGFVRVRYEW